MKRKSEKSRKRKGVVFKKTGPKGWLSTQCVEVAKGKTITEYLTQQGLQRGVELSEGKTCSPESILSIEGGRRYEVGRVIAKGGMGVIHEAKDLNSRRVVAMKVLSKEGAGRSEDLLRFIEEAQITSQLEHPNIIPVHELGLDEDGNVFYTMKYVKGVTLTQILDSIRKEKQETIQQYPLARLLTIFQKACDAVAFAHSKGVMHRDLKPDNIMIGDFGEVLVMDWGLAKVLHDDREVLEEPHCDGHQALKVDQEETPADDGLASDTTSPTRTTTIESIRTDEMGTGLRTMSGRVMGTPGFMAPEQARASVSDIDVRTDIYSMGAILYSILTLRPSVKGRDIKECLRKIIKGEIVAPTAYNRPGMRLQTDGTPLNKPIKLMHCPGGKIPALLSQIAMKAMAVNPADRYATVTSLQQDIEAYQEGLVWHLVIDENFADGKTLGRWEVVGGQCEVKDGELRLHGGEPQILLLKKDVPGDVRIEFECRQESVYLNDVGCFIGAIRSENRREIPSSGYELKYGGYDNSRNVLMRSNQRLWEQSSSPLVRGKVYRVTAERIGSRLRMVVNDEEVFKVTDLDPLSGPDRTAVGLLGWMADTRYTRIRVYTLGTPWKSDILDTAERHLQKGHYVTAMDLFHEVMDSFPDSDRMERARRGFETARKRGEMMRNLPGWREKLEKAWPGASVQLRMDNDGLAIEVVGADISDLEPLRGMPVTALYCAVNKITSLEPLRGMPLELLNCGGNPISDLKPLRGMPLTTLLCECCRIRNIEPLRGMHLTMLNCGGNRIENIAPLSGMKLTWLSLWGNPVENLEPLRGMPLTALYCDGTKISSLEPLRGMSLTTLNCNGNSITDLDPLRDMPLKMLHCGDNGISSLEPLKGVALNMLSCHRNRIKSLAPLKGMPLGALMCGSNELSGLEFFIKNPPQNFLFDCDTISIQELEWIRQSWARDFRLAMHLRNVEVLIALRNEDGDKLRELAAEFRGSRYLFVPKLMTRDDASACCEKFGGRLVTITSKEENDFITALVGGAGWFWIGLTTREDGQHWITGEPFRFKTFVDILREKQPGHKVFFNGTWSYDVCPNACNAFMIKWKA